MGRGGSGGHLEFFEAIVLVDFMLLIADASDNTGTSYITNVNATVLFDNRTV